MPATSHDGRSRWAHYRDRKRGEELGLDHPVPPQPRDLEPHGTWAAVMRHRRAGEKVTAKSCPDCHAEVKRRNAENYRRRKAKRLAAVAKVSKALARKVEAGEMSLPAAEAATAERRKAKAKN